VWGAQTRFRLRPHELSSGLGLRAPHAHSTSFCRASVVRGGWSEFYAGVNGYVYPRTLLASCRGSRVAIVRLKNAYDYEHALASSAARTSSGGYGLFFEWEPTG
jgi:hypothetical protein